MAVAVALSAQEPLPDWVPQLSRVKHHLRANFERIPNYVCQEAVERFQTTGRHPREKLDTLRFDVAHVEGKELLAPAGASRFEDVDPAVYNPAGMLGTGTFSSLPTTLFVSDKARAKPRKAPVGKLAFNYQVPEFLSGFRVTSAAGSAIVGHRGTFWVDAETLDLLRIEDHAVDVPLRIGIGAVDSTVDYGRMRIGSSNVLLPQSASLVVTRLTGTEMRNEIKYSGCREYGSESTVRFGNTVDE